MIFYQTLAGKLQPRQPSVSEVSWDQGGDQGVVSEAGQREYAADPNFISNLDICSFYIGIDVIKDVPIFIDMRGKKIKIYIYVYMHVNTST